MCRLGYGPRDRDLLWASRRAVRDYQSRGVHPQVRGKEADEDVAASAGRQVGWAEAQEGKGLPGRPRSIGH